MVDVAIRDVTHETLDDLCQLCITTEKKSDQAFIKGAQEKRKWAIDMLRRWGPFAKLAYLGPSAVGLLQYEPVPNERVLHVHCIRA